jgi:hypothetical protein
MLMLHVALYSTARKYPLLIIHIFALTQLLRSHLVFVFELPNHRGSHCFAVAVNKLLPAVFIDVVLSRRRFAGA